MARTTVSAAELEQQFGRVRRDALQGPVIVTHHGREDLVVMSADHYTETRRAPPATPARDVQAVPTSELGDDDIAALLDDERIPEVTRAFDHEVEEGDTPG